MAAGLIASTPATPPSKMVRNTKKPTTTIPKVIKLRCRPFGKALYTLTAPTIVAAPMASPAKICQPPADHAPGVVGIAIKTVANPPRATKPIIPMLNSPAKPHCKLTPSDIIAPIRAKLSILSAESHDPEKIQNVVAPSRI